MTDERDELLERMQETVLRLADRRPERLAAQMDETQDKTRLAIRQLARSRVSQILRQLRAAHGLSYEQIQQQTGLSQQMLFDMEYKDRRVTLDELRLLANCFNLGVNDILGIDLE
jgi:ribosome-binding protein aMBF1 (putative translation factor)